MGIFREKIFKIVNTLLLQVLFFDSVRSCTQNVALPVVIGKLIRNETEEIWFDAAQKILHILCTRLLCKCIPYNLPLGSWSW